VPTEDPEAWLCPFCKGPQETLCHSFLKCALAIIMWRRSSHWPLNTAAFSNQPISSWVLAILKPYHLLAITRQKTHIFQLFAAVTLDHIWFSRNSLVHNAVQPEPSKSIKQILPLRISPSQLGNFLWSLWARLGVRLRSLKFKKFI
jgi:hypothetical protein